MYKFVLPSTRKLYTTRETPAGYVDEGWEGKGAAKASLQIIGGKPLGDISNIDLGFARINIKVGGTEPAIEYVHDEDANVGSRNKTVGRGRGQIPLEAWEEAKAEGQNYRDFVRGYKGDLVGAKKKPIVEDIYDIEELEEIIPAKAWYEEETVTPIRKKVVKKAINPYANYYRGREVLPPDLSGSL
jgi:hypothetical protein